MILVSKNKQELINSLEASKDSLLNLVVYTVKPYKVNRQLLKLEVTSNISGSDHLYVLEYDETRHDITLKEHKKNCNKLIKEITKL